MNKNDSLGDRMKGYENIERKYLTRRLPAIIRCDGICFHSFTKGFQRPFDIILVESMWDTAKYLCENIMGCKIAYIQSDEISLLLTDYDNITTQAWYDKNVQKMVSASASKTTKSFNKSFARNIEKWINGEDYLKQIKYEEIYKNRIWEAEFDSRVFNLPKEEVCNYFLWRQQDTTRNSIQMVGRVNFSHKQLDNKNCNQIQEKLFQEKGINFNDLPIYQKRGSCVVKEKYDKDGVERSRWIIDKDIPIFTQDRDYIEKFL